MSPNASIEVEAELKLARARALLRTRAPYMMTTIYAFIPHFIVGLATMGVSATLVLAVDPVWIVKVEDHKVAAALLHEAMHVVRDHIVRCAQFPNKDLANIAADLAINPGLRAAGWELPHGLFPEDYGFPPDLVMEEYYQLLEKKQKQQQQQGGQGNKKQKNQGAQKTDQGQGGGAQTGGTQEEDQAAGGGQQGNQQAGQGTPQTQGGGQQPGDQQTQGGQGAGQASGQGTQQAPGQGGQGGTTMPSGKTPGVCAGRCGGVAGNPSPIESQINEQGRSEVDKKSIIKQTMYEIKQWAEQNGRGSVPAGLLGAIENMMEEKSDVPWERELSHVFKKCTGIIEAGGMDYSLARPSKRSYSRGFPRPGLVQYIPEVAFILDTSGSMGKKQIEEALVHSVGICRTLGIESAWLIQADAGVHDVRRVRVRDLMGKVKIRGGGGTSFDPALRALEKLKPRPNIGAYVTDGDGYVSYRPKGIEMIWVIVRSYYNKKPCDWGHTVIVAEKGKNSPKRIAV